MASNTIASPEIARPDVLVVGGGPAGSAAALLLATAGHSVVLVDRASFPRDKACSEYMSPEAVRILDRLGVVSALERSGAVPLAGTSVTGARGARLHGRFALAGHLPFRPTGLSVSRRILDHVLLLAARDAGAHVLERSAVEGHGIGLALAKRLVELQGGSIGVESPPGQGATFWVELPAA